MSPVNQVAGSMSILRRKRQGSPTTTDEMFSKRKRSTQPRKRDETMNMPIYMAIVCLSSSLNLSAMLPNSFFMVRMPPFRFAFTV